MSNVVVRNGKVMITSDESRDMIGATSEDKADDAKLSAMNQEVNSSTFCST